MTGHVEWTKYIRQHSNLLENCALLSENISLVESIDEIQNDLMPQWYWSTAIPLVVLIVSIAWLTAVESGSLRNGLVTLAIKSIGGDNMFMMSK